MGVLFGWLVDWSFSWLFGWLVSLFADWFVVLLIAGSISKNDTQSYFFYCLFY